jgi:hypothetical protein
VHLCWALQNTLKINSADVKVEAIKAAASAPAAPPAAEPNNTVAIIGGANPLFSIVACFCVHALRHGFPRKPSPSEGRATQLSALTAPCTVQPLRNAKQFCGALSLLVQV